MANPFLMTEEDDFASNSNDVNSNPFLMAGGPGDDDDDGDNTENFNDNPFLVQSNNNNHNNNKANNPFAGFGDDNDENGDIPITTDSYTYAGDTMTNISSAPQTFTSPESNVTITTNAGQFNPTASAMSFFGTTITDDDVEDNTTTFQKPIALNIQQINNETSLFDDSNAYSSEDEMNKIKSNKGAPPRPVPPSQTTQDLISSVADQLDQNSSHLLGRLPATRTPSPVSMRDLHSPSPTPEFGDLLDVSDVAPHNDLFMDNHNEVDSNFNNDDFMGVGGNASNGGTIAFGSDVNNQSISNENPFASMIESEPIKIEPQRPPPPRPTPPRPTPPRRPSPPQSNLMQPLQSNDSNNTIVHHAPPPPRPSPIKTQIPSVPQQQQQQQHEPDLFDMFGTNEINVTKKPPPPKSKEDILSLFSTASPANETVVHDQVDFLSGDILSMDNDIPDAMPIMSDTIQQPPAPSHASQQLNQQHEFTSDDTLSGCIDSTTTEDNQAVFNQQSKLPNNENIEEPPNESLNNISTVQQSDENTIVVAMSDGGGVSSPPSFTTNVTTHFEKPELERENILDEIDKSDCVSEHSNTSIITPAAIPTSASGSVLNMNIASEHSDASSSLSPQQQQQQQQPHNHHSPEQMDTALDFTAMSTPNAVSVNPFASPEIEEQSMNIAPIPVASNKPLDLDLNISGMAVKTASAPPAPARPPPRPVPVSAVPPARPQPPAAPVTNIFAVEPVSGPPIKSSDAFDAFSAKFDSVKRDESTSLLDGFGSTPVIPKSISGGDAWGNDGFAGAAAGGGGGGGGFGNDFENEPGFDSFLAMTAPERVDSHDSADEPKEFNVVIRPKDGDGAYGLGPAILAPPPPPKSPQNSSIYSGDSSPRVNPFDKSEDCPIPLTLTDIPTQIKRTDSQETPQTPLFDDDVSQPLEDFPRIIYEGDGWEIQLRQPNKKKITGQRFWKKIWMRLVLQGDNPVLQLMNAQKDKDAFQELPLQACYSVSEISAQQYDQFGKIFTIKLQYIFYKERPGVRPGQVTKAERLTSKISQFAAYAIQGDYQGVKEFGSDLKKLGLPVEHAPQVSQLFKIGSHSYEDLKQFSVCVEEYLFKLNAHRDRALTYKMEEVQLTAVDELYVEQDAEGRILKQIARVRLHFLGFLSGMPTIELGVNDLWRQGKEVVGRHDIIPVVTEEWIRLEGVEFHSCVQLNEYERSRTIRFQPPDACYIELMRFRVRPPKNRELPLQLKATWCVTGNKVELRADVLVPGFASRKLGQIPCEDVSIRFPIPECWIYLFRVEKHFRYGSVKSAHRRTGKIKGIERILGTVDQLQESLIEVTSGQAKYEHHHRAIVWRCPRLPKEGQGAYTTHQLVVRMALTSYDQIPEQLAPYCYVEFTMPATQVSHVTVRSVSVQDSDSDDPPEKYVRYLARHEYRVGIEHTTGESSNAYLAATCVTKTIKEEPTQQMTVPQQMAPSDSDSDSN